MALTKLIVGAEGAVPGRILFQSRHAGNHHAGLGVLGWPDPAGPAVQGSGVFPAVDDVPSARADCVHHRGNANQL